jgi:hypothetical protein
MKMAYYVKVLKILTAIMLKDYKYQQIITLTG